MATLSVLSMAGYDCLVTCLVVIIACTVVPMSLQFVPIFWKLFEIQNLEMESLMNEPHSL